jgi:hypothetical protein
VHRGKALFEQFDRDCSPVVAEKVESVSLEEGHRNMQLQLLEFDLVGQAEQNGE